MWINLGDVMKFSAMLICFLFIQACAFYPTVVPAKHDGECDLYFKELKMEMGETKIHCQGGGNTAATCFILATVVAGGSAVVSGSIVLVGNTFHWLEKQGRCDDGFLRSKVHKHNQPLLENKGELIDAELMKAPVKSPSKAVQ